MARTLIAVGITEGLLAAARVSPIAQLKPASNAAPFFSFQNAADDPSIIDIQIIDFIGDWIDDYWGFGVTAKSFIDQLSKLSADVKSIRVHINSPGGDVFSALNIANALRDQQQTKGRSVETVVDGLAASAASIILMAGSSVKIADNALVMIHNPWTVTWGEAKDIRKTADELDVCRNAILATYKWHSKLGDDELIALMDATTWMDADAAITNGFATAKVEGLTAAAVIAPAALDVLNVPEKYRARLQAFMKPTPAAPAPMAATDVLRMCREGGCLDVAENLIASHSTTEQVTAAVRTARDTRTAAEARANNIRAICKTAKFDDLSDSYVASGMTVDAVRATVTALQARLTSAQIDGTLSPSDGAVTKVAIDTQAIYARLNGSLR